MFGYEQLKRKSFVRVEKGHINLDCIFTMVTCYLDLLQMVYSLDIHPIYFVFALSRDFSIHMD